MEIRERLQIEEWIEAAEKALAEFEERLRRISLNCQGNGTSWYLL